MCTYSEASCLMWTVRSSIPRAPSSNTGKSKHSGLDVLRRGKLHRSTSLRYGRFTADCTYRIGTDLGVDHEVILRDSRGRRSIDTLALYDPSLANWECWYSVPGCLATVLKRPRCQSYRRVDSQQVRSRSPRNTRRSPFAGSTRGRKSTVGTGDFLHA